MSCRFYDGCSTCEADDSYVDTSEIRDYCLQSDSYCRSECPHYSIDKSKAQKQEWERKTGVDFDKYDESGMSWLDLKQQKEIDEWFDKRFTDTPENNDDSNNSFNENIVDAISSRSTDNSEKNREDSIEDYNQKKGRKLITRKADEWITIETYRYLDYNDQTAVSVYTEDSPLKTCPFRSEHGVCLSKEGQSHFACDTMELKRVSEYELDHPSERLKIDIDCYGLKRDEYGYYIPGLGSIYNGECDYNNNYKNDICLDYSRAFNECPYFNLTNEQRIKKRRNERRKALKGPLIFIFTLILILLMTCVIGGILDKCGEYVRFSQISELISWLFNVESSVSITLEKLFYPFPWGGMLLFTVCFFLMDGLSLFWICIFGNLLIAPDKVIGHKLNHVLLLVIAAVLCVITISKVEIVSPEELQPIEYSVDISCSGNTCMAITPENKVIVGGPTYIAEGEPQGPTSDDVCDWDDVISISSSFYNTVALHSDGTASYAGCLFLNDITDDIDEISSWTNLVDVKASPFFIAGLKSNGRLNIIRSNADSNVLDDIDDATGWHYITKIAVSAVNIVGLEDDGTVVVAGRWSEGQKKTDDWTNIIDIDSGHGHTVGLKSDGTVVAVGDNTYGQCNIREWTNIISVKCGTYHTIGLCSDGTVRVAGVCEKDCEDISLWKDIVEIDGGYKTTVGITSAGKLLFVGNDCPNAVNAFREDLGDIIVNTENIQLVTLQ